MNIAETRAKLEESHVPKDMYSFGWTTLEMMCIEYKKKQWEVYYSERGSKCGVKTFKKENEACKYFYGMVMQDFKQHQEYLLHYRINKLRPLLEKTYREDDQGVYNVVYSEEYGERNYTLLKERYIEGKVHKLVCGGQLADFEDEICVDIDLVKETVEYYYREKGLHNEKYWKLE